LLRLIDIAVERGPLTRADAQQLLELKWEDRFRRYERFLVSGGLLSTSGDQLVPTDDLRELRAALLQGNAETAGAKFLNTPSLRAAWDMVCGASKSNTDEHPPDLIAKLGSSKSGYLHLGEACEFWLVSPDRGVVPTTNRPVPQDFAAVGAKAYQDLSHREHTEWVLTGMWLEELASTHAIHPAVARRLTAIARERRHLTLYVEGSTPDTRFDDRTVWRIDTDATGLVATKEFLYRGDYLMPGTAAVRLKIREDANGA